ncbi:MAG: hypothetical protein V3T28_10085 [Gemmatimonadales bacterium]
MVRRRRVRTRAIGYFLLTGREVVRGTTAIEIWAGHLTAAAPGLSPLAGRSMDEYSRAR